MIIDKTLWIYPYYYTVEDAYIIFIIKICIWLFWCYSVYLINKLWVWILLLYISTSLLQRITLWKCITSGFVWDSFRYTTKDSALKWKTWEPGLNLNYTIIGSYCKEWKVNLQHWRIYFRSPYVIYY